MLPKFQKVFTNTHRDLNPYECSVGTHSNVLAIAYIYLYIHIDIYIHVLKMQNHIKKLSMTESIDSHTILQTLKPKP